MLEGARRPTVGFGDARVVKYASLSIRTSNEDISEIYADSKLRARGFVEVVLGVVSGYRWSLVITPKGEPKLRHSSSVLRI